MEEITLYDDSREEYITYKVPPRLFQYINSLEQQLGIVEVQRDAVSDAFLAFKGVYDEQLNMKTDIHNN